MDAVPASDALGAVISLDATIVAIIAGTVIPILVGIITKLHASSGLKALIGLALAVVVATLNDIVIANNGTFEVKTALVYLFVTMSTSIATYYGVYKPTLGAAPLAKLTSGFGLGTEQDEDAYQFIFVPYDESDAGNN